MATRKYWTLSGWPSLQSVPLKSGEGMKNGVKVLRKQFGVWIWRENTTMDCLRHLEVLFKQLMDFQPLHPWVDWIWLMLKCHFHKAHLDLQRMEKSSSLHSIQRENWNSTKDLLKQQVSVKDNSLSVSSPEILALLPALKEDHNVKLQDQQPELQRSIIQTKDLLMKS